MKSTKIIRITAFILIVCSVLSFGASATAVGYPCFTDVKKGSWYEMEVYLALENNLMNGVGNDLFKPNGTMTRGMAVTVLYRYAGCPDANKTDKFGDVKRDTYYAYPIGWAEANGIVEGTSDTTFSPNEPVTRQDMACMLYRYMKSQNISLSIYMKENDSNYSGKDFTLDGILEYFKLWVEDFEDVSGYAYEAMAVLRSHSIFIGDKNNCLNPKNNITRAEAATIFNRFAGYSKAATFENYLLYQGYYDADGVSFEYFRSDGNYRRCGVFIELTDDDIDKFNSIISDDNWVDEGLYAAFGAGKYTVTVKDALYAYHFDISGNVGIAYNTYDERLVTMFPKNQQFVNEVVAYFEEIASRDDAAIVLY